MNSALGQSFSNLEVILVDDAGTNYENTQIRIFRTNKVGPLAARKIGTFEARGRYILFVEGGD